MDLKTIMSAVCYSEVFRDSLPLADQYKALAKLCHPDTGGSEESFHKLGAFYAQAQEADAIGVKLLGETLWLKSVGSAWTSIPYVKAHHTFELGDIFVGDSTIVYVVDSAKDKAAAWNTPKFISDSVRNTYGVLMPQESDIKLNFEVPGKTVYRYKKTPDQFLLADLLHFKWKEEHAAWFMSRMLDLGCFFKYSSGFIPMDVSQYTLLVSIEYHSVAFTGEFWFSRKEKEEIKLLPKRILEELSSTTRNSKVAEWSIYSSQIRAMTRELLGDRSGSKLRGKIKEPFFNWLMQSGSNHQSEEYKTWQESTLPAIFPVREFVKWPITSADVYRRTL